MKLFKRLDFATVSFRESKALADHVLNLKLVPESQEASLYSACWAGIAVTYARPFVAASGLGSLSSKYEDFPSADLKEVHDGLLDVRHRLYAHRDLIASASFRLHPASHPVLWESRIEISPETSGRGSKIRSVPSLLYVMPDGLLQVKSLCDFQINRISADASKLLEKLAGSRRYAPGIYVLGKDFP